MGEEFPPQHLQKSRSTYIFCAVFDRENPSYLAAELDMADFDVRVIQYFIKTYSKINMAILSREGMKELQLLTYREFKYLRMNYRFQKITVFHRMSFRLCLTYNLRGAQHILYAMLP